MVQHFIRFSNIRKLPRTLALCALALALPCLSIGLQADDYVIAQRVRDHPLDAFVFFPGGPDTAALRERGILNWSASHDLKLHLLRPLSSLSHALDFALWPDAVWFMHLENALLYAAIVWLVAQLYTLLLGSGACAGLAAVFYAFTPAFATSVGWISSRNTLLSMLLSLLSFWLFVREHRLLSVFVHALALLAAEAAVAVLAPVLAYALILAAGTWQSRALSALPHLVLSAAYLFAHTALGYGAAHSGMYLSATQQPWALLQNFLIAVPLYLGSSLLMQYAGLAGLLSVGPWPLLVFSFVSLAVLATWLVPVLRTDARARFFALSALGSIAPLSAVTPQDRLGFLVGFGSCGLLAVWLTANDHAALHRKAPRLLFHLHTSFALLCFVPSGFVCNSPLVGGGPRALNAALSAAADRDVVVLNVSAETVLMSLTAMRQHSQAMPLRSIRALYVGGARYEVQRVDASAIEVRVARGWFSNVIERLGRDPNAEPFAAGDMETTDLFSARVLEVDTRGAPLCVRFEFVRPLDDPRWLWLRFEGPHVLAWTPPVSGEPQPLAAAGVLW